jgi:4-hydroxy-3-polyprenylbenzoate decarboxylase
MGELLEINDEVDWYLELGAVFRQTAETLSPGAIFNRIKGSPPGFRAADFGMAKSGTPGQPWARLAVMLGLPPATDLMWIHARSASAYPKKRVLSFELNYPEPIQEKVRSNWARWGFEDASSN